MRTRGGTFFYTGKVHVLFVDGIFLRKKIFCGGNVEKFFFCY